MSLRLCVYAAFLSLLFSVTAKSQIGAGYSRLTLDTPAKDNFDGFGVRLRLPIEQGGIQINLEVDATAYGSTAFDSPYSIDNLHTFGLGFELAPYIKLPETSLFLIPSAYAGIKMADYESTRILSPYLLDKRDERIFGWSTRVGFALAGTGAGFEVSYGWNKLNFNSRTDGMHGELYIGFFQSF